MTKSEIMHASHTITAPAEAVFAVLADPASHVAIDGTGWVREPVDRAPISAAGQIFRMNMFHKNAGGDYQMVNRVHVYEPPHVIGWEPGQERDGAIGYGGWFWRYDLHAVAGGTKVTLTYDWSAVPDPLREQISFPPFGVDHLENSLVHLAEQVHA